MRRRNRYAPRDTAAARALAPLAFGLEILLGLTVLGPLMLLPFIIWGSGSFVGIGDGEVCVDGRPGAVFPTATEPVHTHPEVTAFTNSVTYCTQHASTMQFALEAARGLLPYLLTVAVLWLLYRSIQQAIRHGLFEAGLPRRLMLTGALLSVGEVLTWALICVLDNGLLHQMAGQGWQWGFVTGNGLSISWIVAGLGLITLGRVMRFAVILREEYEATV